MKVINARNVQDALVLGITHLLSQGKKSSSRGGDVWVSPSPVTTVYQRPEERVLFSEYRDANPFFHLVESAWMLAGRSDVAPLSRIVKRMNEFAEHTGEIHGAYGHRWRNWFGYDQLATIIDKLCDNVNDRQCVLSMWDAGPADDLAGVWRDRPCNTHIYFRTRPKDGELYLDMTVCCRSNDIIWGAYGANAVHFSVLQEYVATHVDMRVGRMYQISNNFHAYIEVMDKLLSRANREVTRLADFRYEKELTVHEPMGPVTDADLDEIWRYIDKVNDTNSTDGWFPKSKWGEDVCRAYAASVAWKNGNHVHAHALVKDMHAHDWRTACTEWMNRRMK